MQQRLTTGGLDRFGLTLYPATGGGKMAAILPLPKLARRGFAQIGRNDGKAITHDRGTVRNPHAWASVFNDGDGRTVEVHHAWEEGVGRQQSWFLVVDPSRVGDEITTEGDTLKIGRYTMAKVAKVAREKGSTMSAAKVRTAKQDSGDNGKPAKKAKVAKVAAVAPVAAEPIAPKANPAGGRAVVFGRYPLNGVLLLMGMRGFTAEDVGRFLDGEGLTSSKITIQTRLSTGRRMAAGEPYADRGRAAEMTEQDLARLEGFRVGGSEAVQKPAAEEAKGEDQPNQEAASEAPAEASVDTKQKRTRRPGRKVTMVEAGAE